MKSFAPTQQSHDVAVEHYLWARKNGFSDRAVLASIGSPAPDFLPSGFVVAALREAWLRLYVPEQVMTRRAAE
jgi:hypothetical protein